MTKKDGQVLSREEFLDKHAGQRPVEVLEGCRMQGLSGKGYRQYQRMRAEAAQAALGSKDEQEFQIADAVAWLTLGVVDPQLSEDEWRQFLDDAPGTLGENFVRTIKTLTGIPDFEVELAKKILRSNPRRLIETDLAVDMLGALPCQLDLPPGAYVELAALRQIRQGPVLCQSCKKEKLVEQLADEKLTCEECGKKFQNPDVTRQLEAMKK